MVGQVGGGGGGGYRLSRSALTSTPGASPPKNRSACPKPSKPQILNPKLSALNLKSAMVP